MTDQWSFDYMANADMIDVSFALPPPSPPQPKKPTPTIDASRWLRVRQVFHVHNRIAWYYLMLNDAPLHRRLETPNPYANTSTRGWQGCMTAWAHWIGTEYTRRRKTGDWINEPVYWCKCEICADYKRLKARRGSLDRDIKSYDTNFPML